MRSLGTVRCHIIGTGSVSAQIVVMCALNQIVLLPLICCFDMKVVQQMEPEMADFVCFFFILIIFYGIEQ